MPSVQTFHPRLSFSRGVLMTKQLLSLVLVAAVFMLSSCAPSGGSWTNSDSEHSIFERTGSGFITPTIYFLPQYKKDLNSCKDRPKDFISPKGRVISTLCEHQWKECLLQGTCKVVDEGREYSLHYHSRIGGEYRFVFINLNKCPYGIGVREDVCLDPYHSVAADLSIQKVGDVIYIPSVRGAILSDGSKHDGYFIVRDTGGAIDGVGRFDFYIGTDSYLDRKNPFVKLGLGDRVTRVPFQVVEGEIAERVRKSRNYPGLPASVKAPQFWQTPMRLPRSGAISL